MIDIKKILEKSGYSEENLAGLLFPMHKYPVKALERVVAGEGFLDTQQIKRISTKLGLSICEIIGEDWKSVKKRQGLITLQNGQYIAELDTSNFMLHIFDGTTLFCEQYILCKAMTLGEFVTLLNNLINSKNYANNENRD